MTDRELLQMALDALDKLLDKLNADICDNSGIWDEYCDGGNAIEVLRAALAQPELEPVADMRLKIKLGSQYGSNICGQWFYLTPADDNASAALTAHTGITAPPQREENHDGEKFVYRAITRSGEIAHFGVYSAAKAWAKSGTVEEVPIRTFKVVQKPCSSCESLARTVMLDQTYHENIISQRDWQGLTFDDWPLPQYEYSADFQIGAQWAADRLKEKNGG